MSLKNRLSTVEVTDSTFRKIYTTSPPTLRHTKDKQKLYDKLNKPLRKLLMPKTQT
jgi:hypothetical protein